MRQGNDHGTQYRSAIYATSATQMEAALRSKEDYQKVGAPRFPPLGCWDSSQSVSIYIS
jgi:peptide methionine sulfoxide reductase MsrA